MSFKALLAGKNSYGVQQSQKVVRVFEEGTPLAAAPSSMYHGWSIIHHGHTVNVILINLYQLF